MIELKNMNDVDAFVKDKKLAHFITTMNDQLGPDLEAGEDEDFVTYFGGNLYLIEEYADLTEIYLPWDPNIVKDATILDGAAEFDIAEWVCDNTYAQMMLITNNGGGNTYFVPRIIARTVPNIIESMKLTKASHDAAFADFDLRREKLEEDAKDIEQEMKEGYDRDVSDSEILLEKNEIDADREAEASRRERGATIEEDLAFIEADLNDTPHEN